ncbi:DUF952 domain-containing protein [Pontibacterium granulatum]|uniref:DUF952 domain-containing protein n=1 Tax=Pontibacterium granulatum TaxID=2036029 RepID=UPI00249A1133|nr:DUF952 domain-containing protein [Pontibacterium granulatum]MDI3326268.1 DUF952 domain-containing protein [Pontibacterium granulatum]
MAKTTATYWNVLNPENAGKWQSIPGTEGMLDELTLAIDENTGDYTRLTRFKAGADTKAFGAKSHDYPEEIYIVSGRLYDAAFDMWLEAGHFASRPPGELHGPFLCKEGCIVLEVSFPSQSIKAPPPDVRTLYRVIRAEVWDQAQESGLVPRCGNDNTRNRIHLNMPEAVETIAARYFEPEECPVVLEVDITAFADRVEWIEPDQQNNWWQPLADVANLPVASVVKVHQLEHSRVDGENIYKILLGP